MDNEDIRYNHRTGKIDNTWNDQILHGRSWDHLGHIEFKSKTSRYQEDIGVWSSEENYELRGEILSEIYIQNQYFKAFENQIYIGTETYILKKKWTRMHNPKITRLTAKTNKK